MGINWTELVIAVIGVVVMICGTLITRNLVPWLKGKNLYQAALVAVEAAEALFGRYHGEEKLAYAINALSEQGFKTDTDRVMNALKAAWRELNEKMLLSGEKVVNQ